MVSPPPPPETLPKPGGHRTRKTERGRFSDYRNPVPWLIGGIVLLTLGVIFYAQTSLVKIRQTLPVTLMAQERESAMLVHGLSDLIMSIEVTRLAPSPENFRQAGARLESLERHVRKLSEGRERDEAVPFARIQNIVLPALDEIGAWLDRAQKQGGQTDAQLDVIEFHLLEVYGEIKGIYEGSIKTVRALLERQSRQIEKFRHAILLILAVLSIVTLLFILFYVRQKNSESRAAVAEAQLRAAVASIPDGFTLFDPDERLVLANENYFRILPALRGIAKPGIRYEDLLRQDVELGLISEARDEPELWLQSRLAAFRNPGAPQKVELTNGSWLRIVECKTNDGWTVAIRTDITELKRRENELTSVSEELWRKNLMLDAALDNMVQGLAMVDRDQRLVICNQRFIDLFNLSPELAQPRTPMSRILESCAWRSGRPLADLPTDPQERMEPAESCGRAFTEELEDGRVISIFHRPMGDGAWLHTYEDVTERHESEVALRSAKEEAEAANRSKLEFLANMSHELRTPLNAIIGFSEVMQRQLLGPIGNPRYTEYARDICESGRHLLALINDILEFSKTESGQVRLHEDMVDLVQVIFSCLRLIRPRAEESDLKLDTEIANNLPALYADGRMVKQILLNLLTNAIKFTQPEGRITLRSRLEEKTGLILEVSDTGIGMMEEDIPKALEPFRQVESHMTRVQEGTGLGLPLVTNFLTLHGGYLDLRSRPGEGTTARAVFPLERIAATEKKHIS